VVKYSFPVPRSRGLQNTACDITINDQEVCTRDIILHLLLGRVALTDGTTHEIETIFNNDLNVVEIDIPDSVLTIVENLGIGPNLQRYLAWLFEGGQEDINNVGYQAITGDYTLTPSDSLLVVTSPAFITLPDISEFSEVYGKRFDIKSRTTIVQIETSDTIDDQNMVQLEYNENLTIAPTVSGWVIL